MQDEGAPEIEKTEGTQEQEKPADKGGVTDAVDGSDTAELPAVEAPEIVADPSVSDTVAMAKETPVEAETKPLATEDVSAVAGHNFLSPPDRIETGNTEEVPVGKAPAEEAIEEPLPEEPDYKEGEGEKEATVPGTASDATGEGDAGSSSAS